MSSYDEASLIITISDPHEFAIGARRRPARQPFTPYRFVAPPTPRATIDARLRRAQHKRARQAARQAKGMQS